MRLRFAAPVLLLALGAAPAEPPPRVVLTPEAGALGACLWNGLPPSVREDYLRAYASSGPASGVAVLQRANSQTQAMAERCAGRKDVPASWVAGAVTGEAIQAGALAKLTPSGIDRAKLEDAWAKVPLEARDCTNAAAGVAFGSGDGCKDPAAPLAFLKLLNIDPKTQAPTASEVLSYYNGKAQARWAAILVAIMRAPI